MSDINITIPGGASKRLLTKGKLCDKNIVVTAEGGGNDRYDEGVADGKQAEYDAFWDAYQQNGNRTAYDYAFAGIGWNDENFKPKYPIIPMSGGNIFSGTGITNLGNAILDLSAMRYGISYLVNNSKKLETLPVLDTSIIADLSYFIFSCDVLHTIEKVILKADGSQTFSNYSFGSLPKLENIEFEGVIGKNFLIAGSPLLSTDSVNSIIGCLKDLTGSTAQTLTFHATAGGKLTEAQKATITAKNWTLVY